MCFPRQPASRHRVSRPFSSRRMRFAAPVLLLLASVLAAPMALARERIQPVTIEPVLQQEVDRLAALLPGDMGIALVHLESGRAAFHNADQGFPMASTMKVAVAVHILRLVDEGKLTLQQQVVLGPQDVFPEMGGPMDLHLTAGSALTIRDLLHMMITVSDNNATDILLRTGGGTAAVNARMRELGIDGLRVDRFIWELLANYYGNAASQQQPLDAQAYGTLAAGERSDSDRRRDTDRYNADVRDTSSARAMALLLQKVWKGEVLKPATTALLQDIMLDTRTGNARLKGMLPKMTAVAHKTGTVGDVINDVGVITLPGDRGHVVATVFIRAQTSSDARDAAIAQVARAAHDYFLFVR
ncbi:class A beta-lactamase [Luteimonas sp. RIT-PG2_3]